MSNINDSEKTELTTRIKKTYKKVERRQMTMKRRQMTMKRITVDIKRITVDIKRHNSNNMERLDQDNE